MAPGRQWSPVSVCGGLASDIDAAPLLIGLGVRGLSAAAAQSPRSRRRSVEVTLEQCRRWPKGLGGVFGDGSTRTCSFHGRNMMRSILGWLQPLGGALLLPIAVLPIAGLLLRLGQPDLFNVPFVSAAGDAIFSNLGLIFSIGVAFGFAKDNNGAAGLAGALCFLVASKGAIALLLPPAEVLRNVPAAFQEACSGQFQERCHFAPVGFPWDCYRASSRAMPIIASML